MNPEANRTFFVTSSFIGTTTSFITQTFCENRTLL